MTTISFSITSLNHSKKVKLILFISLDIVKHDHQLPLDSLNNKENKNKKETVHGIVFNSICLTLI